MVTQNSTEYEGRHTGTTRKTKEYARVAITSCRRVRQSTSFQGLKDYFEVIPLYASTDKVSLVVRSTRILTLKMQTPSMCFFCSTTLLTQRRHTRIRRRRAPVLPCLSSLRRHLRCSVLSAVDRAARFFSSQTPPR